MVAAWAFVSYYSSGLWAAPVAQHGSQQRRYLTVSFAKRNKSFSLADQLLDYIEGGPKLRKWYGASKTNKEDEEENVDTGDEENGSRSAILVTDADTDIGQLVALALIVKREDVRVLVRNAKLAAAAFGSYVQPIVGNVEDRSTVIKACRGVRAIICTGKLGCLADKSVLKGVEHIVYVSEAASLRKAKGLDFLLKARVRQRAAEEESILAGIGLPCTIFRPPTLVDEPGGQREFKLMEVDLSSDAQGHAVESISKEDAATLCVKTLDLSAQQLLVLEVTDAEEST